ncbi:hypothetical protein AURDEDRAFT_172921 [Auricularia subglabra TFB-10046 SS5]|nr:hypothetical protein AURDEDRAFT_172921 [Auricularia subglabra TFB-10046 SS5]
MVQKVDGTPESSRRPSADVAGLNTVLSSPGTSNPGSRSIDVTSDIRANLASHPPSGPAHGPALSGIPNELWLMIWDDFPLEALLVVSHLCRAWRSLAIGCPSLWCDLTFRTSIPSANCPCDNCNLSSDEGTADSTLAGSSNLLVITGVLHRSLSLPLDIRILVDHPWVQEAPIQSLAAALVAHASRIASISFITDDPDAPLAFFPRFSSLPALEFLAVRYTDELEDSEPFRIGGGQPELLLPVLRQFEIPRGIGVVPRNTMLLETLAVAYCSAGSVLPLVLGAPNLVELKLRFPNALPRPDAADDCERLNDACAGMKRISLFNVSPRTSASASRLCVHEHSDLILFYSPSSQQVDMAVLNAIERPTRLWIRSRPGDTDADGVLITANNTSHKHSLWVPRRVLRSAWPGYAPPHFAPRAAIDMDLLALIPRRAAAAVSNLVIMMPAIAYPAPGGIPPFPALETLEFRLNDEPGPRSQGYMFLQIVFSLRGGAQQKLRTLTFTNLPGRFDSGALSQFADSIRVRRVSRTAG